MSENILAGIVADKARKPTAGTALSRWRATASSYNRVIAAFTRLYHNLRPALFSSAKKRLRRGLIRPDFNPVTLARAYQPYAAAISVLTEPAHFQGSLIIYPPSAPVFISRYCVKTSLSMKNKCTGRATLVLMPFC